MKGSKTFHRVPCDVFQEEIYANQDLIDPTGEFALRVSQIIDNECSFTRYWPRTS